MQDAEIIFLLKVQDKKHHASLYINLRLDDEIVFDKTTVKFLPNILIYYSYNHVNIFCRYFLHNFIVCF